MTALHQMEQNPFTGDVTHLTNASIAWRRRVGSYRILFDIEPKERRIRVHHIMRRTSTTYRR